jgi:hypothetical protein
MKKNNYPEEMLKGRMAESLVEELLRKSGNKVYRFGYEAILQNLTQIQQSFKVDSDTRKRIRAIPDFVVVNSEGGTEFVEVKFRKYGQLHEKDHGRLQRIKKFWNAEIIFVNCYEKPFFRVSSPPYFNEKNEVMFKPITEKFLWKIEQDVYQKYEALVEKYLRQALIQGASVAASALLTNKK